MLLRGSGRRTCSWTPGAGARAVLEARARAGACGWSVIVDPKNEAARSPYEQLGFATFAVAQQKWFGSERPFRIGG